MNKKKIIIIIIAVLFLISLSVYCILTSKKKITNIEEDLIFIKCTSGKYYESSIKDALDRPIKNDQDVKCNVYLNSPKNDKITYNSIYFDYTIEGNYEIKEKPISNEELIIYNDKNISIIYPKEHTINKNKKYETIYTKLYSVKLHILDSDKLTFKLSNIKIENNKNIYLLKDYEISYDIQKDSQ